MSLLTTIANQRRRNAGSGGGGYDTDAQDWFDRIASAGSSISEPNKAAANTLVLSLKSAGIWSDIDLLVLPAGPNSIAGSWVALVGPDQTPYNFTSSEFDRTGGVLGVIANSTYAETNMPGDWKDPANRTMWVVTTSSAFSNNRTMIGNDIAAVGSHISLRTAGIRTKLGHNSVTDIAVTPAHGFFGIRRNNSSDEYILNHNGSETTLSVAVVGSGGDGEVYAWAGQASGSATNHCADRIAVYGLGGNFSLETLRGILNTYISALA